MSRTAVFGVSSGIILIVATLVGIALMNVPESAGAAVKGDALSACPPAEVSLDQGYGVNRVVQGQACSAQPRPTTPSR